MEIPNLTKSLRTKRVKIAEDVLAQIKARKFVPNNGSYIIGEEDRFGDFDEAGIGDDLVKFRDEHKKCYVCALGSMLLARTLDKKSSKMTSWNCRDDLNDLFTDDEMGSIESYFEGNVGGLDSKKKLKLLMRNIVDNNGAFVPEQLPEWESALDR